MSVPKQNLIREVLLWVGRVTDGSLGGRGCLGESAGLGKAEATSDGACISS